MREMGTCEDRAREGRGTHNATSCFQTGLYADAVDVSILSSCPSPAAARCSSARAAACDCDCALLLLSASFCDLRMWLLLSGLMGSPFASSSCSLMASLETNSFCSNVATTYGRASAEGAARPRASMILTVSLPLRYDVSTLRRDAVPVPVPVADKGEILLVAVERDVEVDTVVVDDEGGLEAEVLVVVEVEVDEVADEGEDDDAGDGAGAADVPLPGSLSLFGLAPCLLSGGWLSLNSGGLCCGCVCDCADDCACCDACGWDGAGREWLACPAWLLLLLLLLPAVTDEAVVDGLESELPTLGDAVNAADDCCCCCCGYGLTEWCARTGVFLPDPETEWTGDWCRDDAAEVDGCDCTAPCALTLLVISGRTNDFCRVGVRSPDGTDWGKPAPTLLLVAESEAALFLRLWTLPVDDDDDDDDDRLSSNGFLSLGADDPAPTAVALGVVSPPSLNAPPVADRPLLLLPLPLQNAPSMVCGGAGGVAIVMLLCPGMFLCDSLLLIDCD